MSAAAADPRLRPARPAEAAELTELAMRSKAYWGYDAAFLTACRPELTMTADRVAAGRTVVAEEAGSGRAIGFVTLEGEPPYGKIGMLFVEPAAIGRGAGRLLYGHALREAARLGFTRVGIDADPQAEGFYQAMGAVTVSRVPSGAIPGRTLPHLVADVAAP
ncbi:MAG: hypothetical protein QOF98_1521 [Streptomyces sp.]|nr:hypothetical protein [Streptomyces sp.]